MGTPKFFLDQTQALLTEHLSHILGKTQNSVLGKIVIIGCVSCWRRDSFELSSPSVVASSSYWCDGSSPTLYTGSAGQDTYSMDQRLSKSDMLMHVDDGPLWSVTLTVATGTWRTFRDSDSFQPARLDLLEKGHQRAQ